MISGDGSKLLSVVRSEFARVAARLARLERAGGSVPGGSGDAVTSGNLDQFAGVSQTGGTTLTISGSTTLSGGTHSGTNTGDNAANTTYAGDYRAANFVAGTHYLAPTGGTTITSVGTIGTGTWQGTAIGDTYISSAATWNGKQAALVSGTNIKTVNGSSLLGSGDLVVTGGATDLTYTAGTRVLASSTGTDATLPLVTTGDAGLAPASGGGTSNFLRADGTWASPAGGSSPVVYVAAGADTAINSVSDVTIVTRDVTGVGATDKITVEAGFVILNNSTATRVCVITLDFDGLFDVEFSTGALAFSATLMHPFYLRATLDIRSSSLAYGIFTCEGQLAAGIASGTDTTMAATHLRAMGWGTTTSDASGTCTVALKIRSASAVATQTCRLHSFVVSKYTPT